MDSRSTVPVRSSVASPARARVPAVYRPGRRHRAWPPAARHPRHRRRARSWPGRPPGRDWSAATGLVPRAHVIGDPDDHVYRGGVPPHGERRGHVDHPDPQPVADLRAGPPRVSAAGGDRVVGGRGGRHLADQIRLSRSPQSAAVAAGSAATSSRTSSAESGRNAGHPTAHARRRGRTRAGPRRPQPARSAAGVPLPVLLRVVDDPLPPGIVPGEEARLDRQQQVVDLGQLGQGGRRVHRSAAGEAGSAGASRARAPAPCRTLRLAARRPPVPARRRSRPPTPTAPRWPRPGRGHSPAGGASARRAGRAAGAEGYRDRGDPRGRAQRAGTHIRSSTPRRGDWRGPVERGQAAVELEPGEISARCSGVGGRLWPRPLVVRGRYNPVLADGPDGRALCHARIPTLSARPAGANRVGSVRDGGCAEKVRAHPGRRTAPGTRGSLRSELDGRRGPRQLITRNRRKAAVPTIATVVIGVARGRLVGGGGLRPADDPARAGGRPAALAARAAHPVRVVALTAWPTTPRHRRARPGSSRRSWSPGASRICGRHPVEPLDQLPPGAGQHVREYPGDHDRGDDPGPACAGTARHRPA